MPLARGRNKNIAREIAAILYGLDCKLASEWVTWSDPNLKLNPKEIYARDVNAIKKCNIFVAEITKPEYRNRDRAYDCKEIQEKNHLRI